MLLHEQSADIAMGVDAGADKDEGAGDQGIMFGYRLRRDAGADAGADPVRARDPAAAGEPTATAGKLPQLGPDAKSQVTLRYVDGRPVGATSVVRLDPACRGLSPAATVQRDRPRATCRTCCPRAGCAREDEFYVNPTGKFVIGGPDGDAGLTGRKIIVDTYGGAAPHGGGAFSGKDPTKVDRSAAYAARYLAKNVVAAGLAKTLRDPALLCHRRCQAAVDLCRHATAPARSTRRGSAEILNEVMDLSPRGIREQL